MNITVMRLKRRCKYATVIASTIYMILGVGGVITGAVGEPEIKAANLTEYQIGIAEIGSEETAAQEVPEESPEPWRYMIPEEYAINGGNLPEEIQEYIYETCEEYGIEYSLILALIEMESGYRNEAVSDCGAVGYMQVVEKWHGDRMDRLEVVDLSDPYQNILTGIDYLSELLESYETSVALSIYNRGYRNNSGTGTLDLLECGISTTKYSEKIMQRAQEIREALGEEQG